MSANTSICLTPGVKVPLPTCLTYCGRSCSHDVSFGVCAAFDKTQWRFEVRSVNGIAKVHKFAFKNSALALVAQGQ